MGVNADIIELQLPFKAEFVSIARLTASGIANRVGFDIETIEDIKVAVAEVCNKLVSISNSSKQFFKITFKVSKENLIIIFDCEDKSMKCIFDDENDGLGLSIINALMDEVEFCTSSNYLLSMTKTVEGDR